MLRQGFMCLLLVVFSCVFLSFWKASLFLKSKTILCSFVSPDDDEEEQTCPLAFAEDMTPTSSTPKLPPCLQEEGKESDSDSEGPIQYRDEEDEDDEDESHQSKKRRESVKVLLFVVLRAGHHTCHANSVHELDPQQVQKQVSCSVESSGCWRPVWRTLPPF